MRILILTSRLLIPLLLAPHGSLPRNPQGWAACRRSTGLGEFIVLTENSLYIVSSKVPSKRIA